MYILQTHFEIRPFESINRRVNNAKDLKKIKNIYLFTKNILLKFQLLFNIIY